MTRAHDRILESLANKRQIHVAPDHILASLVPFISCANLPCFKPPYRYLTAAVFLGPLELNFAHSRWCDQSLTKRCFCHIDKKKSSPDDACEGIGHPGVYQPSDLTW